MSLNKYLATAKERALLEFGIDLSFSITFSIVERYLFAYLLS